jgi:cell division protein FtsB
VSLEDEIKVVSAEYDDVRAERLLLENNVKMLRPGTINADFLEERARMVLGYKSPNELIILEH